MIGMVATKYWAKRWHYVNCNDGSDMTGKAKEVFEAQDAVSQSEVKRKQTRMIVNASEGATYLHCHAQLRDRSAAIACCSIQVKT